VATVYTVGRVGSDPLADPCRVVTIPYKTDTLSDPMPLLPSII
jgi:hypothetical protein